MDRALEFAPACHRFKILKAECLAMLGRYPEAQFVARYAVWPVDYSDAEWAAGRWLVARHRGAVGVGSGCSCLPGA